MPLRDARSRLNPLVAAGVFAWACAVLLASHPQSANAQAAALWSIGQADHNDKEFALAPDRWSQYSGDAAYVIGQSHPQTDWPYAQPGPDDAWAGRQSHTADIYFSLDQASDQGECCLTISLVDAQHQSPPQLQIRVNGRSWTRNTFAGNGDASINGQPAVGKPSAVTVDFPASLLHAGTNEVSIETVRGSWLIYDAVSLSAPAGFTLGSPPVILHLANAAWLHDVLVRKDSGFQQVLQLQTLNTGPPCAVSLRVAGEPDRTISLSTGRNTIEEEFPESHRAQRVKVQIFASGKPVEPALTTDRQPCRKYTIYCLEHSHMDIGYGYTQPDALARHQKYLEDALAQISQPSDWPSDDRFRWNIESLVEIDDWLKKASPAQIAEFQQAARHGDLGLSALYCNELTGLCRPEELAALFNCANDIRKNYNVTIDSAMVSDVPGLTWGLVPMLAQGGVKYLSLINPGDHLGNARDQDNQAFYWLSPSGKERVLIWQGPNGYQPDFAPNQDSLVRFLADFDQRFPHAPYDMIYDRHTRGDNGPADLDLPQFVHNWNSQYAYPHLIISTTSRMFHDFENKYGKTLHKVRGDATGYWEDGAASTAAATAVNRAAAESIAQDQFLWAMLKPAQYPAARFADAWKNVVLYDEHTWGAYNSWSDPESDFATGQWAYKKAFATDAQQQALTLKDDALKADDDTKSPQAIAVFNTCSWQRTNLVILPAALSRAGDRVRSEQGDNMPSQRLSDGALAFLAIDIPALSSRKFTVVAGSSRYAGSASASADALGTKRMSLRFDPQSGVIASWKVQGIAHDMVNSADKTCRGLNDYLYVLGPSNANVQYASDAKLTVVDKGPLIASIRIDSEAPGAKSLSRLVQVIDGLDEVRIADTIDKLPVHQDEAVHIGFNFNIPSGVVRMDMPWSVVRPNIDQTAYANKSVFPVSRWADISNSTDGVTCATLDSPMMQIGAITLPRENSGGWLKTANTGSALYWNVMNNYWHTNYKAYQSGPVTFHYTLQAHAKYDQAVAQHFGIGQSQSLLFAPVDSSQMDSHLPLSFSNEAVLVATCQPLDNGKDWLVRLFNSSDKPQTEDIRGDGAKRENASQTDLWGGHGKPIALPLHMAPMQVVTLRVAP